MKFLISLIFIYSYLLSDAIDVKYFVSEHNYDIYKLVKKLKFNKEITKNDFDKYHSHVTVFYTDGKITKYETFNNLGNKISDVILDDRERIKKVIDTSGAVTTYFYKQNLVVVKDIWNDKPILLKSFYVNNRLDNSLYYIENNILTKIVVYDFKNRQTINYDGNGTFINKIFLPQSNK